MSLSVGAGMLIGAGVSALGSLISSFWNNRSQQKTNEFNLKANKDLADQAFEQNKQMWTMQNQYNSPVAQMARYKAAGINPNVLYGASQEISSGSADSVPELSYPAYQAKAPVFDFESPLNQFLSASQIGLNDAKAFEAGTKAGLNTEQALDLVSTRPYRLSQLQADLELTASQNELTLENVTKQKLDNYVKEHTKEFTIQYAELQNEFIRSGIRLSDARVEMTDSQKRLNDKLFQKYDKEISKLGEEIANLQAYRNQLLPSQVSLNKSMSNYYDSAEAKIFFEAQNEKNELEHWQESFDAMMNKIRVENKLTEEQFQNIKWEVQHKFYTQFMKPLMTAGVGAYVGGKAFKGGSAAAKGAPASKQSGQPTIYHETGTPYNFMD